MLLSLPWCLPVNPLSHHNKQQLPAGGRSLELLVLSSSLVFNWLGSLLYLSFLLSFLRVPGPQKPHSSATDDIVRANHYDPDEDEDYYRKQLSYFDKLQTGPNKPQAQVPHSYSR